MTESDYEYFEAEAELKGAIDIACDRAIGFIEKVDEYRKSNVSEDTDFDPEWSYYIDDAICDDLIHRASEFKDHIKDSLEGVEIGEEPDITSMADDIKSGLSKYGEKIPSSVQSELESILMELDTDLEEIDTCWHTCVQLFDAPSSTMDEDDYAEIGDD